MIRLADSSVPGDRDVVEMRRRLAELEETLYAIRSGQVDAITIDASDGDHIFTLEGAEEPYRLMVETMSEGAVTVLPDSTVLYCNERLAEMLKVDLRSVMGSSLSERFAAEDVERIALLVRERIVGTARSRAILVASDGTRVPVNVAIRGQSFRGVRSVAVVLTDLSNTQRTENDLERANRALLMLNACSNIAMRSIDEGKLLTDTCQAMVDLGGYRLAWVGFKVDDERKSVRVVAASRAEGDYVDGIDVTWADGDERGNGPVGTTLRTGAACVSRDVATDPTFRPWHRKAIARGFRSIASLPLVSDTTTFGALLIYGDRAGEFLPDELRLLEELADGISIRIVALRNKRLLSESEARFRAVSETAFDAIVMVDSAARIRFWNAAATRTFGYAEREILGQPVIDKLVPARFRDGAALLAKEFAASKQLPGAGKIAIFSAVRKDGAEVRIELTMSTLLLGAESFAVGILRDITERERADERIQRMARFDELTGLLNRRVFVEALQREIAQDRVDGTTFAVLYVDLDHFKDVNDTQGHPVGDLFLVEVAQRLRGTIRSTDTIARLGGDEFAIIASDVRAPEDAAAIAQALLFAIGEPIAIGDCELRSSASVGIALFGATRPTAHKMLAQADVALYRAKSEGRGTFRYFTDEMDAELHARVKLVADFRKALDEDQLFLVYQPQVEVATGRIIGLEALVRWRHPELGLVMPGSFIAAAERSGLIVPLGKWVLDEACRQARAWLDAGLDVPVVGINVSALQFKKTLELDLHIADALERNGVSRRQLELELTESALMETSQDHCDSLTRLRESGIRIAIDDFGNGYSSLDYLRRFPVDRIKIAQNFVFGLETNPGNGIIVRAALGLARELNIEVVVEGVETEGQLALLIAWGCTNVQGYYFARPLDVVAATACLRARAIVPDRRGVA